MAEAQTKPKTEAKDEASNLWTVIDHNARTAPRTHRAGSPSQDVTFKPGEATEMPAELARWFLNDEAFEVRNQHGKRQTPLPKRTDMRRARLGLEDNEDIARLDDLTTDALLARVTPIAGSQKYTEKTPRNVLIKALTDHFGKMAGRTKVTGGISPDESMPDDAVRAALDEVA